MARSFLIGILVFVLSLVGVQVGFAEFGDFPFDDIATENIDGNEATDIGTEFKNTITEEDSAVRKIMKAFRIDYVEASEGQTATFYIKEIINRFLAVIGLVALLTLIFGFYKMFFAKDHEEGFTEAKKIVINAIIALVIIALAWFLVSWFFRIYNIIVAPSSIETH